MRIREAQAYQLGMDDNRLTRLRDLGLSVHGTQGDEIYRRWRINQTRDWPKVNVGSIRVDGSRGNDMRTLVASLIVLAVLYFWDKDYNNGKLLDGLDAMRRDISQHMFHWSLWFVRLGWRRRKWNEDGEAGNNRESSMEADTSQYGQGAAGGVFNNYRSLGNSNLMIFVQEMSFRLSVLDLVGPSPGRQ
jgi:hypothetical protein